jgi:hypothetical protein
MVDVSSLLKRCAISCSRRNSPKSFIQASPARIGKCFSFLLSTLLPAFCMLWPLLLDDGQISDERCRQLEFFDRQIVDSYAFITIQDRASLPPHYRSFLAIDIPEWSFQRSAMPASPQHLYLEIDHYHRAAGPVAFMIVIKNGTIAISVMTAMTANAATYFNRKRSAFCVDFCLCLFALDMGFSSLLADRSKVDLGSRPGRGQFSVFICLRAAHNSAQHLLSAFVLPFASIDHRCGFSSAAHPFGTSQPRSLLKECAA